MDSLDKAAYDVALKLCPEANKPSSFESFKETLCQLQKLLEFPLFSQLFRECAPKTFEYISANFDKIAEGKEIEFFENWTDDAAFLDEIGKLLQAVEKINENTAADC